MVLIHSKNHCLPRGLKEKAGNQTGEARHFLAQFRELAFCFVKSTKNSNSIRSTFSGLFVFSEVLAPKISEFLNMCMMINIFMKTSWHFCPLLELPVTSPLGIAVIKNLENWEQILQEKMDQFEGPPPNYINTYPTDLSVGAGPAILRNKAMLEPENTPFK